MRFPGLRFAPPENDALPNASAASRVRRPRSRICAPQTCLTTIIFFTSAIALAGLRPFGQALAQFMMVWQR